MAAVGDFKSTILDELHTDGALPLLLEGLGHLLELFLDVRRDSVFAHNSGKSCVLSESILTSFILSAVELSPSELTPLVGPVQLLQCLCKIEGHLGLS